MTVTRTALCTVKGCPEPKNPDWHIPWCGHGAAGEHQHWPKRSQGGKRIVAFICHDCHMRIDNGDWGNSVVTTIEDGKKIEIYRAWDLHNTTIIEQVIGIADVGFVEPDSAAAERAQASRGLDAASTASSAAAPSGSESPAVKEPTNIESGLSGSDNLTAEPPVPDEGGDDEQISNAVGGGDILAGDGVRDRDASPVESGVEEAVGRDAKLRPVVGEGYAGSSSAPPPAGVNAPSSPPRPAQAPAGEQGGDDESDISEAQGEAAEVFRREAPSVGRPVRSHRRHNIPDNDSGGEVLSSMSTDTSPGSLPELTYESWVEQIKSIVMVGRLWQFDLGDRALEGERLWPHESTQVLSSLGIHPATLVNIMGICERIPVESRRFELRWSHHQLVYALDAETRDAYLEKAVTEEWGVKELRQALVDDGLRPQKKQPLVGCPCGCDWWGDREALLRKQGE